MNILTLNQIKDINIKAIDTSDLVDIKSIDIDSQNDICDKIQEYFKKTKNPYCFLVEKTPVKISFTGTKTLSHALLTYFSELK